MSNQIKYKDDFFLGNIKLENFFEFYFTYISNRLDGAKTINLSSSLTEGYHYKA